VKCDKCGEAIENNLPYEFRDKRLCDDCYIDLLIGTPDVDISRLPPDIQSTFHNIMKGWHRDRPNRHHYYRLPKLNITKKDD
jgi:hypothetical protein